MTTFELLFLAGLFAFGLIMALILVTRPSNWEAPERDMSSQAILDRLNQDMQQRMANQDKALEERLNRERQEKTQPISIEALEADLLLDDTESPSPPLSNAELLAIEYLSNYDF